MPREISPKLRRSRLSKPSLWTRLSALWLKRPAYFIPVTAFLALLALGLYMGGTKLEESDSFCASCHTQPEESFFQRSVAASEPQDLASFHAQKGVLCIECHAGKGLVGRSLGLMAGAQDLVAFYSGHYPQPAKLEEPLPEANCTRCHQNVLTRQDFNNHFHLFLARWRSIDPQAATCASCHSSHTTSGSAQNKFLVEKTTLEVCQRCHSKVGG